MNEQIALSIIVPVYNLEVFLPEALASAMGDRGFMAVFDTQEALDAFYKDAVACE